MLNNEIQTTITPIKTENLRYLRYNIGVTGKEVGS
jgi:hypothetical protein